MTYFDNLPKSFSENLKQLTKMNDFLLFLHFHKNRIILHCFHRRYEFCMQKYPSKCIWPPVPGIVGCEESPGSSLTLPSK